jgi:transmembrane sensor
MHQLNQPAHSEPARITIPESAAIAAVDWFVELQSGHITPAVRTQWLAWRNAHPDHERAWQRIETVRGTLSGAASPVKAAIAHAALSARGSARRKQAVKVLGVLFFIGAGTWVAERQTQAWRADFRTVVGQQKTLYLQDGTELVLNTDTAVNLYFNDKERRIALLSGEILITTAKDTKAANRPFLVDTPRGRMQALGTVFSVREQDATTHLAVFEGAVEVWPKRLSGKSVVVSAGEQMHFTTTDMSALSAADTVSIAWKDNMLVVKDMRLDAFLQTLARYSEAGLSCDPSVADLRVSGSYPLHNIDTIVDTLSAMLGLHVEEVSRFWGGMSIRFGKPVRQAGHVALKK